MQGQVKIDKVTAQNFLFWKNLNFDIEPGITCIRGANGSGKSLMWRALDHGFGMEMGKRGTSENRLPTGSKIGTHFRSDNKSFELAMGSTKITLTEDGKALGLSGKEAPRKYVADHFSIPRSLYESTVHLSGTSNHPLSTGTPASRLQWFGDVFGINKPYDELLRKVESRLRKVKDAKVLLQAARESLAGTPKPREPMNTQDLKKEWDEANNRTKDIFEELERRRQVKRLGKKIELNYAVPELERLREVTRKALKRYRQVMVEIEAYDKALRSQAKLKDKIKQCQEALSQLPTLDKDALKALKKQERKWVAEYETLKPLAEKWLEEKDDREALKNLVRPKLKKAQVSDRLAALRSQLNEKHEELSALQQVSEHNHKGGQCPTCGTKLNHKAFAKLIEGLGQDVAGLEKSLKTLWSSQKYYERQERVTVDKDPLPRIEPLIKKIKKARKQMAAQEERRELEKELAAYKSSLNDLPQKPAEVLDDLGNPVKSVPKKIDELEEQAEVLARDVELRKQMDEVYRRFKPEERPFVRMPTKALKVMLRQFQTLEKEHEDMYLEHIRIEAVYKEVSVKRKALKAQVDSLKKDAAMADRLMLLREYAGPKGDRITKIKEVVFSLINELNRLVPTMWDRKFVFDAEVTADGMTLFAERNGLRSDITSLSGGETKCWRALCALALLHILPAHMRTDTIILDEIEANLSTESRYKFCRDFIPKLQEVVSKVIVVTPMDRAEMPLVADHDYEVVLEKGQSRLVNQRVRDQEPVKKAA